MKDLSAITKSKKQEYLYWESILYQFSIEPTTIVLAFPSYNEEDVTVVVIDNDASEYLIDEDQLALFGFRNVINNKQIGQIFLATITENDYKRFKSNPKLIKNANFDECIEIMIYDIPDTYKLLK